MEERPAPTKWHFRANEEVNKASLFCIKGVLSKVKENLNESDEWPTIPLGHGDPSSFPCFRATPVAEDAIIDALQSAKFNCYAPNGRLLPARRSIAESLSQNLPYKFSPEDVYLTVGAKQAIEVVLTALARPGANILLHRPGYPMYEACAAFSVLKYATLIFSQKRVGRLILIV